MIHDSDDLGVLEIVRSLGEIGLVNQNDFLSGYGSDHFRSCEPEFVQNECGFGGDVALDNGLGLHTALGHQISYGNSGNNAVSIRVFVPYDKCCHDCPP